MRVTQLAARCADGVREGAAARSKTRPLLWALAWLALLAAAAVAQERPPATTGRHAPPPKPDSVAREPGWGEGRGWFIALGAGVLTSGDLFRVTTADGEARIWHAPAGGQFNANEFLVTLDEDLGVAATFGWSVHPRWLARLDLSWGQMNATAEARVAQTVELYRWERLSFTLVGLGVEARLAPTRLYPFALGGMALSRLSGGAVRALDQTRIGVRAGAGLHFVADRSWGCRLEVRDTWQQFDLEGYGRDEEFAAASFEELGPQHLFEIAGSVTGSF